LSTALIKRLHEQRMNIETEIRSLVDAHPGDMPAEIDAKINDLASRSDELAVALTDRIEAEERAHAISEKLGEKRDAAPSEGDKVEAELRSFLRGEQRSLTITPEKRDLTKGTATAGGHTVPTTFYGQLVEHMIDSSAIMSAGATILNTDSGENMQIPVTTSYTTGALVAEGAAIGESDPAFAQRTLGAYKYAALIQVSSELVEDTGIDLLGFLARQAGRAVGNAFGTHLVTGTGSSQPTGIMTSTTLGATGATSVAGAFTVDNLIDLFYSVIGPYRNSPQAAWLLRDASVGALRKLKDGDGTYLWHPASGPGMPDTFLGKPIYTDPNVAAIATTARSVAFGDMSAYFVRMVNAIRFERSDDFAFNTDLVTFRCVVRGDGILTDQTGAVKHFVGGAT
jgi:HK97 family phage major capsid protein